MSDLKNRKLAWKTLSEFYLDTELESFSDTESEKEPEGLSEDDFDNVNLTSSTLLKVYDKDYHNKQELIEEEYLKFLGRVTYKNQTHQLYNKGIYHCPDFSIEKACEILESLRWRLGIVIGLINHNEVHVTLRGNALGCGNAIKVSRRDNYLGHYSYPMITNLEDFLLSSKSNLINDGHLNPYYISYRDVMFTNDSHRDVSKNFFNTIVKIGCKLECDVIFRRIVINKKQFSHIIHGLAHLESIEFSGVHFDLDDFCRINRKTRFELSNIEFCD